MWSILTGMTGVNGNGNRQKSAKVRAREVMAAKLAEARKRFELDQADLEVLLANEAEADEAERRRDRLIAEARTAFNQRMERINADSGATIVRWLARGGTESEIAAATGMRPADVRRFAKARSSEDDQAEALVIADDPVPPANDAPAEVPADLVDKARMGPWVQDDAHGRITAEDAQEGARA